MLKQPIMRTRGFTLVELSITLAVFALLIMAVMPAMSEWMRNLRVRSAAESIQNGLQRARMEALRTNRNVSFWLVSTSDERTMDNSCASSADTGSWVVSVTDPSGLCGEKPDPSTAPMMVEAHAAGDGGNGVTVASLADDGTGAKSVAFNGFGRVTDTAGQIARIDLTHAKGARALRVVVSPGGSVRMCDPAVTAADSRACP